MDWFYAINGQQNGPVSDAQLDELLRVGTIKVSTLVWRDGMAEWQPLETLRATKSPPPADSGVCVECQQTFPRGDMLLLNHSWVCAGCKPVFLQRLREGSAPAGGVGTAWRMDRKMVMRPDTTLPDRCVCCNAPANGFKLKRQLYWHPPLYFILVIISVLIYVIVALIVRKKALIHIGLCEKHRRQRTQIIIAAWIGVLASIGLFIAGLSNESPMLCVVGVVLLLAAIIIGAGKAGVVGASKIDKDFVWVKGMHTSFLEHFPDWTGPK